MTQIGGVICSAYNCNNAYRKYSDIHYFTFPRDQQRCSIWISNCRNRSLEKVRIEKLSKSYRLCSEHFESSQFTNSLHNRLNWNAVPTIFDNPNPAKMIQGKRKLPALCLPPTKCKRKFMKPSSMDGVDEIISSTNTSENKKIPVDKEAQIEIINANERKIINNHQIINKLKHQLKVKNNMIYKLKVKIAKQQKTIVAQKLSLKKLRRNSSGDTDIHCMKGALVHSQMNNSSVKSRYGHRWSKLIKVFSLAIHFRSPQTYRFLQSFLTLPSLTTLRSYLSDIKIKPMVVNAVLITCLKHKVQSMLEIDRHCLLTFDAMSIKPDLLYDKHADMILGYENFGTGFSRCEPATHALVFMLRGINFKWKYVIGYCLIKSTVVSLTLMNFITRIVKEVEAIDLKVHGIVMDMEVNQKIMQSKYCSNLGYHFFEHPTDNGRKLYIFFDAPHLIKNIRNNLMKYDIVVDGHSVSWKHIELLWNLEKCNPTRLCPKLTAGHVYVGPFSKMKVKLATQIFSHSVSSAMHTLISLMELPPAALHTATFVKKINDMFDVMNSRSIYDKGYKRAIVVEDRNKLNLIQEYVQWVSSWKFSARGVDKSSLPVKEGLLITLQSLHDLCEYLFDNCGFKSFCAARCNQDCVENLFSVIRQKGGRRDNPNFLQFEAALKNSIVCGMLKQHPMQNANCILDNDSFLDTLEHLKIFRSSKSDASFSVSSESSLQHSENFYPRNYACLPSTFNSMQTNCLYYVSGFIAKQITAKPLCGSCLTFTHLDSVYSTDYSERDAIFTNFKQYNFVSHGLRRPSEHLFSFCKSLEMCFNSFCTVVSHHKINTFRTFVAIVERHGNTSSRFCLHVNHNAFLVQAIMKYFFNIRIHFYLRQVVANYNICRRYKNKSLQNLLSDRR